MKGSLLAIAVATVLGAPAAAETTSPLPAPDSASGISAGRAPSRSDALVAAFRNPPEAARPRVWWHWMNGNVTKAGITADLEWMHRIGIAGFNLFDVDLGTSNYVGRRLSWMTPEWRSAFRHAVNEARRLDLEMGVAGSPGWSQAGGPWVASADAMKKVVWSSTHVSGPGRVTVRLPAPPSIDGPFQDMPYAGPVTLPHDLGVAPASSDVTPPEKHGYYADLRVVAVPAATAEPSSKATVRTSAGSIDPALLSDGSFAKPVLLHFTADTSQHWILFEYDRPIRATSLTVGFLSTGQMMTHTIPPGRLEASVDGKEWKTVLTLPGAGHHVSNIGVRTYAIGPVSARFFRVTLEKPPLEGVRILSGLPPIDTLRMTELRIGTDPVVDRWEGKAQFTNLLDYPWTGSASGQGRADGIDLTGSMRPDGTLAWDAPPGQWEILRIGMSLVGAKNHPAEPEATGYEVDKLDSDSVQRYLDAYLRQIGRAAGPEFGKTLKVLTLDGFESGGQNATPHIIAEFKSRRGYDPTPYLPVLTGRVVENSDVSERFLWDFRRTLADLLRDDYYRVVERNAKRRGLKTYAQAVGPQAPADADALEVKGQATVPMAEFWIMPDGAAIGDPFIADLREAASAAHIYGKPIVAAESFTSYHGAFPAWGQSPFYLKQFADQALALGLNQFVLHTSVHQPFVDGSHQPGLTLGPFGQNFTRNITWAEQAKDWISYLARTSYLLQQGRAVADIAYFYGEGTPANVPFWKPQYPAVSEGYGYDYLNAERLLKATVEDGDIVLPGGARYRMLVIPAEDDRLTLPIVRKLSELVAAGATLIAPPPRKSPSLQGFPKADDEIASIVSTTWGGIDGKSETYHSYGKGKVLWGPLLQQALPLLGLPVDVEYNRPRPESRLVWTHRSTPDADIYFIANRNAFAQEMLVSFRVAGRQPELWDPSTGDVSDADFEIAGGRTSVPIRFDPHGSAFVVFRRTTSETSRHTRRPTEATLTTLGGEWLLDFEAGRGAPKETALPALVSLTDSANAGIKYFSGTVTYRKTIEAPSDWLSGNGRILLDLGEVRDLAQITVNGVRVKRIFWKPPFRADITGLLHDGSNRIEIAVTNMWTNRLIGDLQPGTDRRYGFTNFQKLFTKDSQLLPSGLLGPVRIVRETP